LIQIFKQFVDDTSDATVTRDINSLCKQVNDFIQKPSVLVQKTEMDVISGGVKSGWDVWVKLDYEMKTTGGSI